MQIWREADVHFIHEPRTIFASLVPPRELLRDQPRAIVPDAAVDLALPPAATRRYVQQAAGPHTAAVDTSLGRL